ncbi:hypothetical protein L0244_32885 [bacterium]|nr:hypothetical protein [bacterium]
MVKTKRRRILFAIGTVAMALAGTGLTFVNNFEPNLQIAAITITFAACFTLMEIAFLWGHKELDDSSKTWRKAVLTTTLVVLVGAMGFAVYEELQLALAKFDNRAAANNSATIVQSTDRRAQRGVARDALKILNEHRQKTNALPFVIGYVIGGLSLIVIGLVGEKKRERKTGAGNLLATDAELAARVQHRYGLNPQEARAYLDRNGKGASVWHKSKQIGYLAFESAPDEKRSRIYDPAENRKP